MFSRGDGATVASLRYLALEDNSPELFFVARPHKSRSFSTTRISRDLPFNGAVIGRLRGLDVLGFAALDTVGLLAIWCFVAADVYHCDVKGLSNHAPA